MNLEDILFAMQQRNLVYNGDFRYYSNQVPNGSVIVYGTPDGWMYKDQGQNGKVDFDPSTDECVITKSSDKSLMTFKQNLHEFPRWEAMLLGQQVTGKVVLKTSVDATVSVALSDGIFTDTQSKTGKGNMEFEVGISVNDSAKFLSIAVESTTAHVIIGISSVCVNVGSIALRHLPCMVQGIIGQRHQYVATEAPPAEELSLCKASEELSSDYTRLDSVLNKRFGEGTNGMSLLPDMRGYFSRAWDNGAAIDPDAKSRKALGKSTVTGDHVGTLQEDEFLEHQHGLKFSTDKPILIGDKISATIINTTSTSKTENSGGKETRPKNIDELYTIKWA